MSSWPVMRLADLAAPEPNAMTDGPFGSKLKSEHYVAAGVRVIRLGNIKPSQFDPFDEAYVTEEHAASLARHAVESGDLVIAALAEPVGRCCEVPPTALPAIVKADCVRFKPGPRIRPRFLMYWLNSPEARQNAEASSHGVGRLRINMAEMRELPVPLPPLVEQDALVAAIESHFSRVDVIEASLQRAKANLKRARSSILKAAVEGRLVPTEAELARAESRDYEPASVLLDRILDERRRRWSESGAKGKYKEPARGDFSDMPSPPAGWILTSVDAVGNVLLGRRRAPEYVGPARPYFRVANVKDDRLDLADILEMPFTDAEYRQYELVPGDILVSEGQSPELLGQSAIYRGQPASAGFQATLHRFRALPGLVSEFAQVLFRAWVRLGVFRARCIITTNIGHLTRERFTASPFMLPPLAEQHRIVAEVDRRLSVLAAVERTVDDSLTRCARLRQSILKRAFEGRLVPPDATDASAPHDRPEAAALT